MTTPKQHGGFLLDLLFGDGKRSSDSSNDYNDHRLTKKAGKPSRNPLRAAINSEATVMKTYEALAKASKTYYDSYATHMQNLITLDDINGMTGLQTTFKNVIVEDVFRGSDTTVNKHNPMLLRNYIVTDITPPRMFRKEHMMRQIKYKLSTGFALKDTLLIQQYDVGVDNNKAVIKFVMVNGDKLEKQVPIDKDITLDVEKLTEAIRDVISAVKKKVDYQIDVVDDYDFQDLLLDVPGVQVADKDTIIARKVKELKESVKIDKAILDLPDVKIPETVKKALKSHTSGIFKYKSLSKKKSSAGDKKARVEADGKGSPAFGKDKLTKTGAKNDVELALLKDLAEKGATPELHAATEDNKEGAAKPASGKKKSFTKGPTSAAARKEMEFCRQFNENKAGCDAHKDRCNYSVKNNKCYKSAKTVPT